MKNLILIFGIFLFILNSCSGTQQTTNNNENLTPEEIAKAERDKTAFEGGYLKCEVVDLKGDDGCGILIKDLKSGQLFNPISWHEDFVSYRVAGNIVYLKYTPSKISQSNCFSSIPIVIEELKLAE